MKVTIVTITWNNRDGLERTLDSIRMQTGLRELLCELVVVDNSSTDGTSAVVEAIDWCPVRFLPGPDHGIYDAMNKGTQIASGEAILYLNSGDCFSGSESLRIMTATANSNKGAGMWIFGALQVDPQGSVHRIRNQPYSWVKHAFGGLQHCHAATLFSRRVVQALGGYSEEFGFIGDFDLILRVGFAAPVICVDRVCVCYEGGGISAQRRMEIPQLRHAVRVERFGLSSSLAKLDAKLTKGLSIERSLRSHVGVFRRRYAGLLLRAFRPLGSHSK